MPAQTDKMLEPFLGAGITLQCLLHPFRKSLLEQQVIVVLGSPHIDIEWKVSSHAGGGFEFFQQVDVIRIVEELIGQLLDRLSQRETKRDVVQANFIHSGFFQKCLDMAEV